LHKRNYSKPGVVIIEGHVQGLSNTRSLGKAGIPVYIVDKTDCIAKYSKYCTKFFKSPGFNSDDFVDFLVDLAKKESINGWVLIPSNDHAVYTISRYKTKLEEFYKVITPSIDIIDKIYDKRILLETAKALNIPIPETCYFTHINDNLPQSLNFPVITKGRFGLSFYKAIRKKALLADNEHILRVQMKLIDERFKISNSFTQEMIPYNGTNKTISFTAFCVNGDIKTCWMGVKLREHPVQFGTATFAESVYIEGCYNQSIPLLKELNYTGVCEVEYLCDPRDGKYKLIEINARTWLWVGLARACGVDYARLIYNYVNNIPCEYPRTYQTGLRWYNPISDSVYSLVAIFKRTLTLGDYLRTNFTGEKINALFADNDWKPGFAYIFNLFSFLKQR